MMETREQTTSGNGADTAEPTDHYVEKIEAAVDKFADFKVARVLAGDLSDTMLEILRTMPTTWAKMSETDQTVRGHAVSDACRKAIREAVALLETHQRVTIECLFKEVAFKEKGVIVAKLGMEYAEEETRLALTRAQGKEILIVVADAAQYMGRRAPMAIDKQQPDLLNRAEEALAKAQASQELREKVEREVDADLDTILAGDASEQPAGRLTNLAAEREAALKDPFAAGKAAGLQGFNETRNPLPHPSTESAEWLRGHAEGEQEREELRSPLPGKRRDRRAKGPDQASAQ